MLFPSGTFQLTSHCIVSELCYLFRSSSYAQSTSPWLDVGLTLHDFGFSMDNPTPDRLEMVIGLFNDLQKQEDLLFDIIS